MSDTIAVEQAKEPGANVIVGLGVSPAATPTSDPVGTALLAEASGFDFISVSDHPTGSDPTYETLTLLTWLAANTARIGLATRVLGVPFRRPAMVAKISESLQRLAAGRLILGMGGGYSDDEIRAVGGPVLSPREKVDGLADALEIVRAVWRQPAVSYVGPEHTVDRLVIEPKPDKLPPIWLGTYGPRALAVTGRLADGWIPSLGHLDPAEIPVMMDRIDTAAVSAGRHPGDIRKVLNVSVHVGQVSVDVDISGSGADVAEHLGDFSALGFGGFNVMPHCARDIDAFAAEVLPTVHARNIARRPSLS